MKFAMMVPVLAISAFSYAAHSPQSTGPIQTVKGISSLERRALQRLNQPVVQIAPAANAGEIQAKYVLQRRERIQRVLVALDAVASATLQLKPETAERLEPVVVDLAEQAIDLSRDEAIRSDESEATLQKLETTVTRLMNTMNRIVEPEMSL